MFPTFKIFVIYLFITSYTNTSPVTIGDGATTFNLEKKITEEMRDFNRILEEVSFKEIKFYLKGKLEEVMKRVVKAEYKNDILMNDYRALETQKERGDLYRVLLGIGHRVDQLEEILSAGSDIMLVGERDRRWKKILELDTPIVRAFRDRIVKEGLDVNVFANNVQQICQERNERAGHVDVSLPEALHENSIKQILQLMKIHKDQNTVITLQLLISPLTLPLTTKSK